MRMLSTRTYQLRLKNVRRVISWNVGVHTVQVKKSWVFIATCSVKKCTCNQRPQPATFTCEEVWAWAPWSRSTEAVSGTACAPPTSAWAPGTWHARSCRLSRGSRWWRRIQTGKRGGSRRKCVAEVLIESDWIICDRRGRRLTAQGHRDLDRIAGQVRMAFKQILLS